MSYTLVARLTFGKYGDVMSNTNPRSVTRTVFASPVFLLAHIAYVISVLVTPGDWPAWWVSMLVQTGIAAATYAIERWYVIARAKTIVTQGIIDAAAIRPELFRLCPEHGDGCDAKCRSRQSARRS